MLLLQSEYRKLIFYTSETELFPCQEFKELRGRPLLNRLDQKHFWLDVCGYDQMLLEDLSKVNSNFFSN